MAEGRRAQVAISSSEAARTRASAAVFSYDNQRAVRGLKKHWTRLRLAINEGMTRHRPGLIDVRILLGEVISDDSAAPCPDESFDTVALSSGQDVPSAIDIDVEDVFTGLSAVPVRQLWNNTSSVNDSGGFGGGNDLFYPIDVRDVASPILDMDIRLNRFGQVQYRDKPFGMTFFHSRDDCRANETGATCDQDRCWHVKYAACARSKYVLKPGAGSPSGFTGRCIPSSEGISPS